MRINEGSNDDVEGAENMIDRTGMVRRGIAVRIAWGPIIGGTIAALSTWILLYSLGLALGLSAVDPSDASSLRGSGIFTGVWSLVTPLVALFVGGMVASRGSGLPSRGDGALHGLLVWGLTTLVGVWLVMGLLTTILGGALDVSRAALQTGGAALGQVAGGAGNVAQSFGLDADAALAPVNRRLQAQGKPPVSADQMQAALRDVMTTAVRTGQLDRGAVTSAVAAHTALSRADAEDVAAQVEQQFTAFRARASQTVDNVSQTAQTGALKAADATGKAFWGVFGALFLGLMSAIGGALVGVARRHRPSPAARAKPAPLPPPGAHPVAPR
ncbi:MAG TPA: hypothetical protein VIU64_03780 [Polyangia bacterium]